MRGKVSSMVKKERKTKVFIHVGTNDMVRKGEEEIIDNMRSLIQECRSAGKEVEVAVCSIPSRRDRGPMVWRKSEAVNNRLFSICREERVEYIDLRGYLISCRHPLARDGVHYSMEGAKAVGECLANNIFSFLR